MKFRSDRQRKAVFANMFSRGNNKFAINPVMIEGYTGSKIYTDPYGGGASGIVMDDVPVDVVRNTAILAGEGYKRSPTREDVIVARNQDLLAGMPVYSHADGRARSHTSICDTSHTDVLEPVQKEYIPGGYAAGKLDEDFCPVQLEKGRQVELEHVIKFTDKGNVRKPTDSDMAKANEIAKDHCSEIPDYYDRLEEMEDGAKEDGAFIDVEALKKSGEFAERPKAVTLVDPTPLGPMLVKEDFLEELRNKPLPNVPRNEELIRKLKESGV